MNPDPLPLRVKDDEIVARFVTVSDWVRSDQTVRQEAFIPHPYPDTSVTRHLNLADHQLWKIGQDVANARAIAERRSVTLYGSADVKTSDVRQIGNENGRKLDVEGKPLPENPNHAAILGWPPEKSAQKSLDLDLAALAKFVPKS